MVEPKRRLTVLNNANDPDRGGEPGSAPRRPWQWVGFGTLAIFTTWIPLAAIASRLAARAETEDPGGLAGVAGAGIAAVALYVVAVALGAALGGFLVGRWGTGRIGVREAALAGLGASVVAAAVTWISFGPSAGALLVTAVSTPMAAFGGRLGLRARRP